MNTADGALRSHVPAMRWIQGIFAVSVCGVVLAGGGCGEKQRIETDNRTDTVGPDAVIATVDGDEVRARALLSEYETVPADRRAYYAAHRQELLDFVINRRVIVAEARAEGVDKDPQLLRQVAAARRFVLRTTLTQELTRNLPPTTDKELRARYREDVLGASGPKLVTQTIVYRMPTGNDGERTVHEVIRKSREAHLPFGTIATRDRLAFKLVDPGSPTATLPPRLVAKLKALPVFDATPVMMLESENVLFYKEPLPYEQARPVLQRAVAIEQKAKVIEAWLNSERATAQVVAYPERFTTTANDDEVLATVNGADLTVGDARCFLQFVAAQLRARYEAEPKALVGALVNEELIAQAAEARGLHRVADFKARMAQVVEGALIRTMRGRVLSQIEITITDEELRELARQFAGGDMPSEFIALNYIANADKAKVEQALKALKAGKDFSEVHAAWSSDKRQDLGVWSDTTIESMPKAIRTATEGLQDGEYSGVFEMEGRFLIVRVTRRSAVVNLEPWREQLRAHKQNALFLKWVATKRANHRIAVNAARLNAVELPETGTQPPAPPETTPPHL